MIGDIIVHRYEDEMTDVVTNSSDPSGASDVMRSFPIITTCETERDDPHAPSLLYLVSHPSSRMDILPFSTLVAS